MMGWCAVFWSTPATEKQFKMYSFRFCSIQWFACSMQIQILYEITSATAHCPRYILYELYNVSDIGSLSHIRSKGSEGSSSTAALRKSWSRSPIDFLKIYKQLIYRKILDCHKGGYVEFCLLGRKIM